jgi:hypothetical protein
MSQRPAITVQPEPDDKQPRPTVKPRSTRPPTPPGDDAPIIIPSSGHKTIRIGIESVTPLLVHNWSEKAKGMIRHKQFGKARLPKAAKDPVEEYEASLYRDAKQPAQFGVPLGGFKAAMVDAGALIEPKMVKRLKVAFHILADGMDATSGKPLVYIEGQPEMNEDFPRISMGTVDLRYRAMFHTWKATLTIRYMTLLITGEQVVNLVNLAGQTMGICEWRPSSPRSRTGTFGLWTVTQSEEE